MKGIENKSSTAVKTEKSGMTNCTQNLNFAFEHLTSLSIINIAQQFLYNNNSTCDFMFRTVNLTKCTCSKFLYSFIR
jgi:hypothetical protein